MNRDCRDIMLIGIGTLLLGAFLWWYLDVDYFGMVG